MGIFCIFSIFSKFPILRLWTAVILMDQLGGGGFPTLLVKWLVVANEGDLHRRRRVFLLRSHHDLGIRSHTGGPGKQAPNMIKLLRDQGLIGHPNRRIPERSLIKLISRMGAKDIPRRDPSESQEPQLPSTCHPLQPAVASPWWVQSSPWRSTARLQTWAHSIRFLIIEWPSTTGLIFRQSYVSY